MAEQPATSIRYRLEPDDEYCHRPDDTPNYNESMYFNMFDPDQQVGGWWRLGNRVNEGYAEMSNCIYLPGGRVAFMFARPKIETNDELSAGGMKFEVLEPFRSLRVAYEGNVCLLENPLEMADPKRAFRENPIVPCRMELRYTGVSPMFGGQPLNRDGTPIRQDAEKSFAKAHYEQHCAAEGFFDVDGERVEVTGFGLRDKSWGARSWQAIHWYRWLPMNFGRDFAMMISIIGNEEGRQRKGGMVLRDGEYVMIRDARIESEWDENDYQTRVRAWARTDEREYEIEGEVLSLIPLRNRRKTPDGRERRTRITEGMTRYTCDGKTGYGLSEYLDQIVDGKPVGRNAT